MMPSQVPYSPVPTQTLQNIPTPEMNPRIPEAAFGGTVAQAEAGLGKTVEGVGDEIFTRAVAMQHLANETDANKADAEYMIQAGKLHADFSSLRGDAAYKAFPQYQQNLQELRTKLRDGLGNADAQKMYDASSLSTMGRTIFNGAGHAATEFKSAYRSGLEAKLQGQYDQLAQNPGDEAQATAIKGRIAAISRQQAEATGNDDPGFVDEFQRKNVSLAHGYQIQEIAKTDYLKAQDLLDKYRSGMTVDDINKAENEIRTQRHSVGSINIANEVVGKNTDEEGNLTASAKDLEAQVKARAKEIAPDDPKLPLLAVQQLKTQMSNQAWTSRMTKASSMEDINTAMQNGADSMQKLLADPKGYAAFQQLAPSEQNKVPAMLNRYVASRDHAFNQQSMTTLKGMSENDVLRFLDVDPTDPQYRLSQQQQRTVMGWQADLRKNSNQNPQVQRAMSWIKNSTYGSTLQSLQIFHRDSKNPDDYDHFVGALSEEMSAYQEQNKKPADSKVVLEQMVPQLLATHTVKHSFWWDGVSDPAFKDMLNTEQFQKFQEGHAKARADAGEAAPSLEESTRLFYRGMAQKLFKKKETP